MRFEAITHRIRVSVEPRYLDAESSAARERYVFLYRVRLENLGSEAVQLLYRHWLIHDSVGDDSEVDGEGVVGEQPVLEPGGGHAYTSYCVLSSPGGYMEGYYTFRRSEGTRFRVRVPRFVLQAPLTPPARGEWESGEEVFH